VLVQKERIASPAPERLDQGRVSEVGICTQDNVEKKKHGMQSIFRTPISET